MTWVKEILNDLKVGSDNASNPVFGHGSPVTLNQMGDVWLVESGLKDYLDTNKVDMLNMCEEKRSTNPYEVQNHIFKHFDTMSFKDDFEDKLKKFAFEKGTTMNVVRRVGAIYFRDLCLKHFGMSKEDIDKHDPGKTQAN